MDIKDSYLHGTVGVVKSIDVDGDNIKYTLADVANTTRTVTLPLATTTNNGLAPKVINTNAATVNSSYYVLASTDGSADPSWYKLPANSFSNDDTKVTQTSTNSNAEYRVLLSGSANDTSETTTSYKSYKLTFNPSTHTLSPISIKAAYSETSIDSILKPSTIAWYFVTNPGVGTLPSTGNDNGILWLGHHGPEGGSTGVGYGYLLGFTAKGIFARKATNSVFQENWDQIAYTTSDITGNAASADKLKTARKLWGLNFDGSADVSGALSGVTTINMDGDIVINDGTNHDRYIKFQYNNTDTYAWRLGYTGSKSNVDNDFVIQTTGADGSNTTFSNVLQLKPSTKDAIFSASVTATSFIGNLDGTYINKLTGYTKATAIGSIADTDTLNTALGKLEYKTDFIYNDLFGTDNDDVINKWSEIVNFIDSVKEGTDILDEFVTRKTELEVIGKKTFINSQGTIFRYGNYGARLIGSGEYGYLQLGQTGGEGTKTHKGKITGISAEWLTSLDIWSHQSIFSGSVTATKLITKDGTSSQFVKGDGSLDSNTYATTSNLENCVTLNTALDITGLKTFKATSTKEDLIGIALKLGNRGWEGNMQTALDFYNGYNYTVPNARIATLMNGGGKAGGTLIFSTQEKHASANPNTNGLTERFRIGDDGISKLNGKLEITCLNGLGLRLASNKTFNSIQMTATDGTTYYGGHLVLYGDGAFKVTNTDWSKEYPLLHSGNYTTYTVKKDGTGASGTWDINITGNAATATTLKPTTAVSTKAFSLSNASWTDTGYTFTDLATGTYAIQVTSGTNLVASGIMSVYKNLSDSIGDEIPLHVYGTAGWRPYLRTFLNKLQISSNDKTAVSGGRTVTIKIAQIL